MPYHSADDIKGIGVAGVRGVPTGITGAGFGGVGGRSGGDGLALDLQFAADKAYEADGTVVSGTGQFNITSRKGPPAKFTRGSGATRVNELGLIEWAPENLVRGSDGLTTGWALYNSATRTPNSATSPDGSNSASLISFSALNNSAIEQEVLSQPAGTYTFSVYMRADSPTNVRIGALTPTVACSLTTAWQRFSVTVTTTSTGTIYPQIFNSSAGGAKSIYVWGAQLERSTTARAYIPTTTAAAYAPRFDHDPVSPFACRGLLIEEGRTNLILQSENFASGTWIKSGVSPSSVANVEPDGSANSDLFTEDTSNSTHRTFQSFNGVSGTVYTLSVFLKFAGRQYVFLENRSITTNPFVVFDIQNGTVFSTVGPLTPTIQAYPNGWYRCSVTGTANATGGDYLIGGFSGGLQSYTGSGGPAFYAWGAQVEAGSFPTSYIPTTTGTLARAADTCSITAPNFATFWNNNEGTIFASGDARTTATGISTYVMANSGANANQVSIYRNATTNTYGVANSGSYTANITVSAANGSFNKIAGSYITNDARAAFNNVLGTPDTSVIVPTNLTRLNIGSSGLANSEFANGCIAAIRYFKKPLSNDKLQALTA